MRFKKGSKVEVLNTRDSPYGSWCSAVIISGNGHYYNVIYDICPSHMVNDIIERVPRKVLRPCPPVQRTGSWDQGDLVEVFHSGSWKHSTVEEVAGAGYYFVKLWCSSVAFKVHNSSLRLLQSWQDSRWVVMQKKNHKISDGIRLTKAGHKHKQNSNFSGLGKKSLHFISYMHAMSLNSSNHPKPRTVLSQGVKRRSAISAERHDHGTRKRRAVGKDTRQHLLVGYSSILSEKVDAVACPSKTFSGLCIRIPCQRIGYPELCTEGEKLINLENDTSSVCSSTGSNSPAMSYHHSNQDLDDFTDEAYSFGGLGFKERSPLQNVDMQVEVHKVELHAYRSTLEALYLSGPLSWEQESMMTDLRYTLNISDDEHRVLCISPYTMSGSFFSLILVVSVLGVKKDLEACLVHQLSSLKSLDHSLSDRAHLFSAKGDYLSDYDDFLDCLTLDQANTT